MLHIDPMPASTPEISPATRQKQSPGFLMLGGHPAVDFANTLIPPPGPGIEFLQCWADVIDWLTATRLTDGRDLLLADSATAALIAVRDLRQKWKSAIGELIEGCGVQPAFIEELNSHLQRDTFTEVLHIVTLVTDKDKHGGNDKPHLHLHKSPSLLRGANYALAVLARSIAEFLATAEPRYLRRCSNTNSCVLVFYDTTKNHRRQWCSNSTCGNRHKVAEFRRRQSKTAVN